MIRDFRDLKVWQLGIGISKDIFELTETFPKKYFELSNQMIRSSISISSNIAEGNGRESLKEYLRFLSISLGSVYELRSQIYLASSIKIIGNKDYIQLDTKCESAAKMLIGLRKSLKKL